MPNEILPLRFKTSADTEEIFGYQNSVKYCTKPDKVAETFLSKYLSAGNNETAISAINASDI